MRNARYQALSVNFGMLISEIDGIGEIWGPSASSMYLMYRFSNKGERYNKTGKVPLTSVKHAIKTLVKLY